MQTSQTTFVFLVLLALVLAFLNSFQNAANIVLTVVSTRSFKPHHAVMVVAFFSVASVLVFKLKVAMTIAVGLVNPAFVDHTVVFGALVGALVWSVLTGYYGIASSSSHALLGGLIGATLAKTGLGVAGVFIASGVFKIWVFIVLAPAIAFVLGGLIMLLVGWMFRRKSPAKINAWFRALQWVSTAFYSLGHGANDAQKTMGIIFLLLLCTGRLPASDTYPPAWVIVLSTLAVGLGTVLGGWRMVKTMGQKLVQLKPAGGFCAESGGAITLILATALGIPVSSTHTIAGSLLGASSTLRAGSVRWGLVGNIAWSWVITLPASACVAAAAWYLGRFIV